MALTMTIAVGGCGASADGPSRAPAADAEPTAGYNRKAPESDPLVTPGSDPSYPSAGAAIAGAASRVLSYLYPEVPQARFDQDADDAARLRVVAGTS